MANTSGRAPASVLVTGASRGIGLAIATRFAAADARVTICARDVAAVSREHPGLEGVVHDQQQVNALDQFLVLDGKLLEVTDAQRGRDQGDGGAGNAIGHEAKIVGGGVGHALVHHVADMLAQHIAVFISEE